MELIFAILGAGPIGYLTKTVKQGVIVYVGLWAVVFLIQTVVVHSENADDIGILYFVINAVMLCVGLGLNRLGSVMRDRRQWRPRPRCRRPAAYPTRRSPAAGC